MQSEEQQDEEVCTDGSVQFEEFKELETPYNSPPPNFTKKSQNMKTQSKL
eukprot:TRINITY_DN11192_c0_g1_i1.p6 TRINITY_DN11192_c0_g1~~TRINITY_DN11192_c0_g1_i1.p6  ORF type:complete len:50 (+),score=14.71 TRINITY_DN11192_c0_g1_i1:826-975(+)